MDIDDLLIAANQQANYQEHYAEEKTYKPKEPADEATTDRSPCYRSTSIFVRFVHVRGYETSRVNYSR